MVVHLLPKQKTGVQFSSLAPYKKQAALLMVRGKLEIPRQTGLLANSFAPKPVKICRPSSIGRPARHVPSLLSSVAEQRYRKP